MRDPEERIREYLRARADMPVPSDLRWPGSADDAPPRWRSWWRPAALGATAAAVVVVAALALRLPLPSTGPGQSATTQGPPGAPPTSVDGMPVLSVENAFDLLQRGDLDGRAVAVLGYFNTFAASCPFSGRYVAALESYCRFVAFSDDAADARLCESVGSGTSCHLPTATSLDPYFLSETNGSLPRGSGDEPLRLVLVGHGGDARQWHCPPDIQGECAKRFVVDRVTWIDGRSVPLAAQEAYDQTTYEVLTPRMTLDHVSAGLGGVPIAAAAVRLVDVKHVDPRWNFADAGLAWLVRTIERQEGGADPTRAVTVTLVDDATGRILDAHPLPSDVAYRPARLWSIATTVGVDCCTGDVMPFLRVADAGGSGLHAGRIEGGAYGSDAGTTFGPGAPLLLRTGTYSVEAWLAGLRSAEPAQDRCSTEIRIEAGDDLMLEALFPDPGAACTFGPPTAPRLTHF